jgi:hypothetical protein
LGRRQLGTTQEEVGPYEELQQREEIESRDHTDDQIRDREHNRDRDNRNRVMKQLKEVNEEKIIMDKADKVLERTRRTSEMGRKGAHESTAETRGTDS